MLQDSVDELRALQAAGRLPTDIDPSCLLVMLMAAAMAPTTLPHVIDGACGADPTSPEFIGHFADQVAILARHIGLDPPDGNGREQKTAPSGPSSHGCPGRAPRISTMDQAPRSEKRLRHQSGDGVGGRPCSDPCAGSALFGSWRRSPGPLTAASFTAAVVLRYVTGLLVWATGAARRPGSTG
jgi:hypothetical protein